MFTWFMIFENNYGEFHRLYWQLRNHPERVFESTRMSMETFDFLLSRVSHRLQKQTTNYRKPISHAQRLVVTIRWDFKGIFSSLKHQDQLRAPHNLLFNGYWESFYFVQTSLCVKSIHITVYKMFVIFHTVKFLCILYIYGLFLHFDTLLDPWYVCMCVCNWRMYTHLHNISIDNTMYVCVFYSVVYLPIYGSWWIKTRCWNEL
jgi:hypothetical protein